MLPPSFGSKTSGWRATRYHPTISLFFVFVILRRTDSFTSTEPVGGGGRIHTFVGSATQPQHLPVTSSRASPVVETPSRWERPSVKLFLNTNPSTTDPEKSKWHTRITEDPRRSIIFSGLMMACGSMLGPFLDSYHSAFGVLKYDEPLSWVLWGSTNYPALTTAWWVPELFGVAGLLIGWLYVLLDVILETPRDPALSPSPPKIFLGISFFTLQYWLSGILVHAGVDRTSLLNVMSLLAALGFVVLDGTTAGFVTSAATGLGGPLIEIVLIWCTMQGKLSGGYHYNDLGETGFFPLWIVPVYFLGGPANGNLARGFWNWLSNNDTPVSAILKTKNEEHEAPCPVCNDTRRAPCPNCDAVGTYVAMGNRTVKCTSCQGRGFVICRTCFDRYDEDPYDIDAIRETISRMPD